MHQWTNGNVEGAGGFCLSKNVWFVPQSDIRVRSVRFAGDSIS
jgi:hypothetical protein